ncbi:hypothetical protein MKX03_007411 [Papaver bracteatum]|nr:hypothetical protein MKX03_007411 [Papaver bracteatum]
MVHIDKEGTLRRLKMRLDSILVLNKEGSPSVVFIKDLELVKTSSGRSKNEEALTKEEEESAKVEGTGVVSDLRVGHNCFTNYHVFLEDAHGQKFSKEGKLVGFDPTYDLAILKIEGNFDLKPSLLGTSGDLRVGQNFFAIGNPYGYENTLTTGVVSGLARDLNNIVNIV